jgi:hypothetical protein
VNDKVFDWGKKIAGGSFAALIALAAMKFLTDEGVKDGDFQRTRIQENTAAMTRVAGSMEDVATELKAVAGELDGVKDEQAELVATFRPMAREFKNAAEAVTEQVEQAKADAETK